MVSASPLRAKIEKLSDSIKVIGKSDIYLRVTADYDRDWPIFRHPFEPT